MAEETVAGTRDVVRARLGCECDAAASRLTEFGLEAVRLDLKFGDGFERWRQERRLSRIRLPVRVDRNAVERRAEHAALAAAERRGVSAAACFGHRAHRSNGLRIAPPTTSGSSSMSRLDTVVATFASSVEIVWVSVTTFTDSVTDPRFSVTSTRAVVPAFRIIPSTFDVWNP